MAFRSWGKKFKDDPTYLHFGNISRKLQGFLVLLQHFVKILKSMAIFTLSYELLQKKTRLKVDNVDLNFQKNLAM